MQRRIGVALATLLMLVGISGMAWAGKVGREFRINTYTMHSQDNPSVASLSGGGFVVVWNSFRQDGSEYGVYGQRYASTGARAGTEFRANKTTAGRQHSPSVAGLDGGDFVVAWTAWNTDRFDIFGQHFDAAGAPSGPQWKTRHYGSVHHKSPSIARIIFNNANAIGIALTWSSSHIDNDGSLQDVYRQLLTPEGKPLGGPVLVNRHYTTDVQNDQAVAGLRDGDYVVIWTSAGQDGSGTGVYGRRHAGSGGGGPTFHVNTYTANSQASPSVAGLTDGGFIVAWSSYGQDGSGSGIYAQRYDAPGNRVGGEFRVNAYAPHGQSRPSVAALADGGYVITWQSAGLDGSGAGIYAQRYSAAGARTGGNFRVNMTTAGNQLAPSVAGLSNGGFVIVWEGADGSRKGIYGRLFAP